MPLPDSFWESGFTPLLHERIPGRIFLDVILHQRDDWPDEWRASDIWDHPNLREIQLSFVGAQHNGDQCVFHLIDVMGYWFHNTEPWHRVAPSHTTYTMSRDKATTNLGNDDLCKRTAASDEDIEWLLDHWRPDRHYDDVTYWWRDSRSFYEGGGLHPDELARIDKMVADRQISV